MVGQKCGLVRRILFILTYLVRCNEVYENVESLADPGSGSIFGRERGVDEARRGMEDKIAKELVSTDVESIVIPQKDRSEGYPSCDDPKCLKSPLYPSAETSDGSGHEARQQQGAAAEITVSPSGVYTVGMPK